jgi:predicted small secreted protein
MRIAKWILLVCGLALICMVGSGCDTLVGTMINSTANAIGKAAGGKDESLYDQIQREGHENWQRTVNPHNYDQ